MRAVVVGSGVVGLTTALRLRRAGVDAHVWAAEVPPDTTSDVAAALWYPYRALPENEVTRWAADTYSALVGLAVAPGSGVRLSWGTELFREPVGPPWWETAVPDLERPSAAALPAGYVAGYRFRAPVVDMSRHLPWLHESLLRLGGSVRRHRLTTIEQACTAADAVVVCAGLGARELVPDADLTAVRGQVLRVGQVGLDEWLLDQSDPALLTYVVPRASDVVLGGTAEPGSEDGTADEAVARAILNRCSELVPALAGARVLGSKVGLRPVRATVRLEEDASAWGARVLHNYGHGGAGVTLAWGCAGDIVRLLTGAEPSD